MDRALRRTLDQVRDDVRSHDLWRQGARLLVACSGGRDSMVAWELLRLLAPSLDHHLVVAHVDHGLQSDAAAAAVIHGRAAETDTQVVTAALAVHPGANVQGRARDARYAALEQLADQVDATRIVTAHHAQDQAETVLLRASRGAGPAGLGGIHRRRGRVVRPLLGVTADAMAAVARACGVAWWDDPTNAEPGCTRNKLRHSALPALEAAMPGATAGLARTADNLRGTGAALEHWVAAAIGPVHVDGGTVVLARAQVPATAELLAPLVAHVWAMLEVDAPSRRAVRQISQTLRRPGGGRCSVRGVDLVATPEHVEFSARSWPPEASRRAEPPGAS